MVAQTEQILQWIKAAIDGIDDPVTCVIEPGERLPETTGRTCEMFLDGSVPMREVLGQADENDMYLTISLELEVPPAAHDVRRAGLLALVQDIGGALTDALAADPQGGGLFYSLRSTGFELRRSIGIGYGLTGGVMTLRCSYGSANEFI